MRSPSSSPAGTSTRRVRSVGRGAPRPQSGHGSLDGAAGALAGRARGGGRQLPEGGAHDPLDLARPAAGPQLVGPAPAADPLPSQVSQARGDVHLDVAADPGDDLLQGELDDDQDVPAGLLPRAPARRQPRRTRRTAEERVDHVVDAAEPGAAEPEGIRPAVRPLGVPSSPKRS
jgi:hypothetical protein